MRNPQQHARGDGAGENTRFIYRPGMDQAEDPKLDGLARSQLALRGSGCETTFAW